MKYKLVKSIDEVGQLFTVTDPFFEGLDYPILLIIADNNGVVVIDNKDLIAIETERQAIIAASISE